MDPRFSDETIDFSRLASNIFPKPHDYSIETVREKIEKMHIILNEKLVGTFDGTLEEKQVQLASAEVPITIYTPVNVKKDKIVVYFHGGGNTVCNRKTHDAIVSILAKITKTVWVAVEFRRSPEHKYPIWLEDACGVTRHIIKNKTTYGVDETAKVGIAGDSSGASMGACIHKTVENIDFQILVYGAYNSLHETPSQKEFADPKYFLPLGLRKWFFSMAFDEKFDEKNSRLSLIGNSVMKNVPPTLFIVAELDPLRDYGYEYKELLEKAGVKTKLVLIKGVVHWFFGLPGIFPKACEHAADVIEEFMASI